MQLSYSNATRQYQKQHRWNSTWKKITMFLASVVVFVTTYALILPAITMETAYICGQEAHIHDDSCYKLPDAATVSSLICTTDALNIHTHDAGCYNEAGVAVCGYADFVLHTHDGACYDTNGSLSCLLPEVLPHIHHEGCWQQPHAHGETCYTQQRGELVCTIEEGSVHFHDEACYIQQQNLTCTVAEAEAHMHFPDTCYETASALLCTEPEVEPHTHSDGCYAVETTIVCGQEESEGHAHTSGCYAEDGSLICTLPEIVGHFHTDVCEQTTTTFTCTLEETEGHIHGETCYSEPTDTLTCTTAETEGHAHASTCYETVSMVACPLETDVAHVHTDSCYLCTPVLQCAQLTAETGAAPTLVCERDEVYAHTHEAVCFDADGSLVCGLLEVFEHQHGDTCFMISQIPATQPVLACGYEEHEHGEACIAKAEADNAITMDQLVAEGYYCGTVEHTHAIENGCFTEDGSLLCTMTEHKHIWQCQLNLPAQDTSDMETADDWAADLPELTGEIASDLIAVAESQLGYQQSAVNYIIGDEEVLYYSRYADWWGSDPYGDWTAKFVAFCLDYAGITEVPLNAKAADWPDVLAGYGQWHDDSGAFLPIPADLIFFDTDSDGTADRVGIITAVNEIEGTFDAVLERRGMVKKVTYDLHDSDIMGYARIPGNEPALELLNLSNVQNVINLIDAMPSCDEIYAQLDAYYEADDTEGEKAYLMRVGQQGQYAYACYQALSEEEQAQVPNIQKLMESSAIWSAVTLEEPVDDTVYYCDRIAHEHSETCYNTENELICGYSEEHTHIKACLVDPAAYKEATDEEASLEGQYVYHSPYNLKYQESSHDLDTFDVVTFVLIPEKDIGEDQGESWLPNIIDWNGRADANYIVAYCSDAMTSTSTTGATYATFTLDNARFTSEEQRRVLSGIIAHSYPFITASEMKAQLEEAYANGEITEAKVLDCAENEYIVIGHKDNGDSIFRYMSAKSQKELLDKLHRSIDEYDGVDLTEQSRMTLGEWLDIWLAECAEPSLRPSTLKGYRGYAERKLKPHLGQKQISKITTADVQKLYRKLQKEGGESGSELSPATIQRIHGVLHQALDVAVTRSIIAKNPANDVTLPKRTATPKTILNDEQLERFMAAIKADELWHDFFYLEITTGLRRGELCGLMWSDFDEQKGTLSIRRTLHTKTGGGYYVGDTKTGTGRRNIKLPPSTLQLLSERKKHSISQWIFPNPIRPENPVMPNSGYHRMKKLLAEAGLPNMRFHDLRHTFATHALTSGVDVKTLSGILGHTKTAFTLDTYTHVTGDMHRKASEIVGGFMEDFIVRG